MKKCDFVVLIDPNTGSEIWLSGPFREQDAEQLMREFPELEIKKNPGQMSMELE